MRTNKTDIQQLALKYKTNRTDRNFTNLINSLECPLYVFLSEYINGYENIRHIMCNTYEIIWTKFDNYNINFKFTTWVFCIAKNLALNEKRTSKAWTLLEQDNEYIMDVDFSDLLPPDAVIKEDFVNRVIDAIKKLPEPYATSMYLKDVKHLTCKEISELMETKNNATIRGRISKARRDVNEYMLETCPSVIDNMKNIIYE